MKEGLILLVSILVGFTVIGISVPLLKKMKAGQEILVYVTEHKNKSGTPTMAGLSIVLSVVVCFLIFTKCNNTLSTMTLVIMGAYCLVGALDDFIKIKFRHNEGLKAYQKIIVQAVISVVIALYVYNSIFIGDLIRIPFINQEVQINWWIIPLVIFIFLSCTNGVNLTDGLDGLATSVTTVYLLFMGILLSMEMQNLSNLGDTLQYSEYENLLILIIICIGVLISFLFFNCFPAKVFMGDAGSMALGAVVACVAIFSKMSLYIPILGIMYVVSCVTVLLQVGYFKITKGKRIWSMAPYHHHLQHKGLSENRIAIIYSIVTVIVGCILVFFN